MKPKEFFAVMFGTFLLLALGDGVVANVVLAPRMPGTGYNWNTITIGWAFAVIVTAFVSGADNNPALTLAAAIRGKLPWSKVGPYLAAEFIGAFLGAAAVYLVYRDGLAAAGMPNVWSTGPGSWLNAAGESGKYSLLTACVAEFVGTMVLTWGVLATSDRRNSALGLLGPFVVGGAVLAVGLSLGGPSGYSINPARDFGPRVFGLLAGTQGLFDGLYWLIAPVLIPFISAPIASYLFDWFFGSEEPEAAKALGRA